MSYPNQIGQKWLITSNAFDPFNPIFPLLPAENAAIPFNLHPSLPHSQMMQSLWQQLKITQTLIKHLSSMILLDVTNNQSQTTSKNLFDLITKLPPMQPMALPTNLSHFPACKKCYLQAPSTGNKHWYQPQAQDYVTPLSNLFWFFSGLFNNSPTHMPKILWKFHSQPTSTLAVTRST